MKTYKNYIYLRHGWMTYLYGAKYNVSKVINLINNYSLETGANIIEKTYLGDISSYENGRIIKETITRFDKTNQTRGLSLEPRKRFTYQIIQNESGFIKALLGTFTYYPFPKYIKDPYILINFSKIYDMLINKQLNNNDIQFLKVLLNEFTFFKENEKLYFTLPEESHSKNKEVASVKNSYILKFIENQNINNYQDIKNVELLNFQKSLEKIEEFYKDIDSEHSVPVLSKKIKKTYDR